MTQLGFPDDWRSSPTWGRAFSLDPSPVLTASLLTAPVVDGSRDARAALTRAEVARTEHYRTPEEAARAMKAAQRSLLRAYRKHQVAIEIELGKTKHYPAFQFRDGKIIDALRRDQQNVRHRIRRHGPNTTRRGVAGLVGHRSHLGLPKGPGRLGSITAKRPAVFSLRAGIRVGSRSQPTLTSSFVAPRWMTS